MNNFCVWFKNHVNIHKPIGRLTFFLGYIALAFFFGILGVITSELNLHIFVSVMLMSFFVTVSTAWWVKRVLDIKPEINIKFAFFLIFVLLFLLGIANISYYALMSEILAYLNGSPGYLGVSDYRHFQYAASGRTILGFVSTGLLLYLTFKKGHEKK